jgi:hypothetical protein
MLLMMFFISQSQRRLYVEHHWCEERVMLLMLFFISQSQRRFYVEHH